MGVRLLQISVLYFVLGVGIGIAMGMTENFTQLAVHAHVNLLGWVSLSLVGLIYLQVPTLALTRLAKAHFWLHNLGLPVMMVGLFLLNRGHREFIPLLGIGASAVGLGVVMLALNVTRNLASHERVRRGAEEGPR
jgi:hypothetical protein